MKDEVINAKEILFTNKKGEKLSLEEIMDSRLIKSVTLNYLSKKRLEKIDTFSRRMYGAKTEVQDKMSVEINSHNLDLTLVLNPNPEAVVIKFSSDSEFKKVLDDSYDESTIKKQYLHTLMTPCHLTVPILGLEKIDWDD